MYDLVFPYLLSMAYWIAVVIVALVAFLQFRGRALRYERLERNLPDACRYQDLQDRLKDIEQEFARAQAELFSARQAIAERNEAEAWLREHREELLSVEAERSQQEHIRAELTEIQRQLAEEKDSQFQLAKDMQTLEIQCEALKEKRDDLQAAVETAADKCEKLANETTALKTSKAAMESECAGLESQLLAHQTQIEEAKASLERRLRSIEQELTEATSTRDRALATMAKECQESQKARDLSIASYKNEADKARTDRDRAIQESNGEISEAKRSRDTQLAELRKEQERAIQECNRGLMEAKKSRDAQLADLRKEMGEVKEAMSEAWSEYESAQDKASKAREEVARSKAQLAGLQSACEQQNIALQEIRKNTDHDTIADSRRTTELWVPWFKTQSHKTLPGGDEMEQLETVRDYMGHCGLVFSDRVLKAFHTSLKVSDISPLVVLAGISGTGKSELPRRYAEAMNIHFLNMAVQPRWDSPQDMFGFFNYLEGRFRATPLGQALIQMDPYHYIPDRGWDQPKDWAKKHSLADQMLLVLLDEMNLARIEYYFSEFLSRLETRRGIDPKKAADRRKAEIGLDVGSSSDGNSTMQLFVGTNVLFVGTMNEDETTQTLSDKVVDRANVLRFGSPRNLRREVGSNGKPLGMPDSRLSHKTWESWCNRELPDDVSRKVNDWIAKLNEALTAIRRPFAHRTSLAIRNYVANYPGLREDDTALHHAMSDQLEQKILPKFRGEDPSDPHVRRALNTLLEILSELKDEQLVNAINESNRDRERQFIWMGIDRCEKDEGEA